MQADAARAGSAKGAAGIGFLSRSNAPAAAAAAVATSSGTATPEATAAGWRATHRVPTELSAWAQPDPAAAAIAQLPAGLDVTVTEERGSWAHVTAENGWEGWVDGRGLQPLNP
jgi:SH3-like domain-containing protein